MNTLDKIGDQPNPVGGFTKERIALRRAIAMGYNLADQIRIHPQEPGDQGRVPDSAGRHRPTSRRGRTTSSTTPPVRTRCSTGSATRRAAMGFRTQPDGNRCPALFDDTG
jgi:hypothetical protein